MFSRALFRQSCKANGTMWSIITVAVCFMLACVMLISGNGNIGVVKNSIQDTIIIKEVDAQLQKRALTYYATADANLQRFDLLFSEKASDTLSYLAWCSQMPEISDFADDPTLYAQAVSAWQNAEPKMETETGRSYADSIATWKQAMPVPENFSASEEYDISMKAWQTQSPATQEMAVAAAYAAACEELQSLIKQDALAAGYEADSVGESEMLGSAMYSLNPNGMFNDFYTENGESVPAEYDYLSLLTHIGVGDIEAYLTDSERSVYRHQRAAEGISVLLAGNMTNRESVEALLEALSSYGVTAEKYDSFGYTYPSVKHMAQTAVVTYQGRLDYELGLLQERYENREFADESAYREAVASQKAALAADISTSFLSTLPTMVSDALEEVGQADLYTLIVGSIFYKLAGLLLPIIYMIMASNHLIAGQVDSGSMAYVLATSTKRSTVVFTQALYLIGSLLAMFSLTTATGCICLSIVTEEVELTYQKLILLNVGAFLVLFALSGLCFFTSCFFDRSRRSMAIGGGLSVFALVAAMLGLFGSPVIPSVVRLDTLNYFNYTTVISLFDVVSIMEESNVFLWKFAILAALGIVGYAAGAWKFTKKDLPL